MAPQVEHGKEVMTLDFPKTSQDDLVSVLALVLIQV